MSSLKSSVLPSLISVVCVLILWEFCAWFFQIQPFILPRPSQIFLALTRDVPLLAWHGALTFRTMIIGYAIGVGLGLALAVLMTLLPWFRSAVYPIVIASQTVPKIAIAPLLILWFGFGILPKILMIALLAFFPVLVNALNGLESTDRNHLELMRSVDANFSSVYWHIRIPSAVPAIFAGLKLALTVSVIGAIVGEWVVGNTGLGYLLIAYNSTLETDRLFAALLVLIAISTGSFFAINALERRFSWKIRLASGGIATTGI